MSTLHKYLDQASAYFTEHRQQERSTLFFFRGLVAFTIFKLIVLWTLADELLLGYTNKLPGGIAGKILLLPSFLITSNPGVIFSLVLTVLLCLLFVRPNFFTNLLLFWIALNLYRLKFPVTNGSDYVLLAMTLYCIPLSYRDFRDEKIQILNISVFNLFRLLAQVQLVLIYLISAWDKLMSPVWTSGKALLYISRMDTVFNPLFYPLMNASTVSFVMSWLTILFEILFVVLIWQKRTRLLILCVGVIFHLVIWFMLSLPDFALLMIVCYLIFLEDKDLHERLRLQPR